MALPHAVATTTTASSTTSTSTSTTPAPTTTSTTLPYVENSGTGRVSWGAPFTVIDQGVPLVDSRVTTALDVANASTRPCPSSRAITATGQRFLGQAGAPGVLSVPGAIEAAPLTDGGAIVTRPEAAPGNRSVVVNAFYVDASGSSTRLTGYVGDSPGRDGVSLVVGHLRVGSTGLVYAALQQLPAARNTQPERSTELVIDPATRTISAVATGPDRLVFDDDLSGNAVVGRERAGVVDWRYQDATPIGDSGCEPAAASG